LLLTFIVIGEGGYISSYAYICDIVGNLSYVYLRSGAGGNFLKDESKGWKEGL